MTNEELVKTKSTEIIKKIISNVVSKKPAEIRFNYEDEDQWAIVTMNVYEKDQEISLRLHANDVYDLHFGYYDDDDEFIEIVQLLSDDEKKLVPDSLKKIMKKVLADEEGLRVAGSLLSR